MNMRDILLARALAGGSGGSGGSGGAFVLRLTAEELTHEDGIIVCTANYDELAKALESGRCVNIVFPAESIDPSIPFTVMATPSFWSPMNMGDFQMLQCGVPMVGETLLLAFTNGTYLPQL